MNQSRGAKLELDPCSGEDVGLFRTKVLKLASDNGFSQKIFVWGTIEFFFSCQNFDRSLS